MTAFRSLGINLANSLEKGHPVVVYGRMRINQWTNGERTGTTVEIDAYNVGHDLTRGQSTFVRVARPQLEQHDRLADPAVQQAGEALDGSGGGNEAERPTGPRDDEARDDEARDDEGAPYGLQLAADAGDDVQPEAGGFDVDAADTDAYEVVGAGAS